MKNQTAAQKQLVKSLKSQVKELQTELTAAQQQADIASYIGIKVQKSQARFKKVRNPKGRDIGIGEFFLMFAITATKETLYIPLSIASGKKTTGFVYHIEGTAEGMLSAATISCRGEGIMRVTTGTIQYCKIPSGKTALFRILIEIKGQLGKVYKVVINKVHYKLNMQDHQYKKMLREISSTALQFH